MKKIKVPVGDHLFKVDDSCVKLFKRDKIIFQRLVAKLIFLSKRAWPDIHLTIAFLTTRVRYPDEGDWKNLWRVLRYLDATINSVKLHLNKNDLNVVHWWVDASYVTHPYLKVQTGATISIRKGCVTSASKNQKVNETSSTIIELFGVHKASPQVLWTTAFLQNQGFEVNKATLYQYNMSAMLVEKNGRAPSSIPKKTHQDQILFYPGPDREWIHWVGILS